MRAGAATVEGSMEVPREAKNRTATGSRHPTPGHISRQNSKHQACSSAALFRRDNTWKQSKCPQTEEWLEQKWYMNTEDKIMSPEATRMQLETIQLSEASQKRKTNAPWYYFRTRSASAHGLLATHVLSCSVLSDSAARLLCPWNFPGKNAGVGCHFLLQGIFLTQGSNFHLLHLLHRQADSSPPCHLGILWYHRHVESKL